MKPVGYVELESSYVIALCDASINKIQRARVRLTNNARNAIKAETTFFGKLKYVTEEAFMKEVNAYRLHEHALHQEYQAQSLKLVAERAPTVLLEVSLAAEMIEIYEENT